MYQEMTSRKGETPATLVKTYGKKRKTMKKIFLMLAVAAAALACTKEQLGPAAPDQDHGQTVFSGGFLTTKITLGDRQDDGTYPALWNKDDRIAVYNAADGTLLGTASIVDSYSDGDKKQVADFVLNKTIANGTKVKVVFPANEDYEVPAEQSKGSATNKILRTRAESGEITIQDGKASFSLSHENAVVRVRLKTSEFVGWQVKNVSIYSQGADLSAGGDYARVTYSTPTALTEGHELAAVFMTKPIETETDFYVAVKLVASDDPVKTVCLSKLFKGKTLNAGEVNVIPFTDMTSSTNALAWYNPVCTRYIPEGGWAYGTSNTFMCAPEDGTSGIFDVKAQGDFLDVIRYAKEPKGLQLRCGNMQKTGQGSMWTVNSTTPSKGGIVSLDGAYSATIKYNKKSGSVTNYVAGVFNLCDSDNKVIWSYLCWAANAEEKTLTNGVVMNTNLGFGGIKTADNSISYEGVFYQWGRPFPFGSPNPGSKNEGHTLNADLRVNSFKESAENAHSIATIGTDNTNKDWWQDGTHKYDLWGNPEKTTTSAGGEKSIFDPCPMGWKVISAALLNELNGNGVFDDTKKALSYRESIWSSTQFYSENAVRGGGEGKGLYWADNAVSDNDALYFEFENGKPNKFEGKSRAFSCAVRCMKDTDNR